MNFFYSLSSLLFDIPPNLYIFPFYNIQLYPNKKKSTQNAFLTDLGRAASQTVMLLTLIAPFHSYRLTRGSDELFFLNFKLHPPNKMKDDCELLKLISSYTQSSLIYLLKKNCKQQSYIMITIIISCGTKINNAFIYIRARK